MRVSSKKRKKKSLDKSSIEFVALTKAKLNKWFFNECQTEKSMYIVPGVYTYHFEYDLPNDLPTSCEEKYAAIRYMASVHIVHASLDEKVHTMPFTVIKPFNLNAESVFKVSFFFFVLDFHSTHQECSKQ